MKIRLESSVFRKKIIERSYRTDFRTNQLCEEQIDLDSKNIFGSIEEIQLDGLCVVVNNVQTSSGYSIKTFHDSAIFKLHFELEGNYCYTLKNSLKPFVNIPNGHCNLFYLPQTEGTFECHGKCRKSLEIFFTRNFIKSLAGKDYPEILRQLGDTSEGKKCFLLWEESRPFPHGLQQSIREIIQCPYQGQIKKTYLEAKITSLLIHFIVEKGETFNSVLKKEDTVNNDYVGLLKAEEYIRKNLKKPITIAELATIAGFNTSKLKHNFKKTFSMTIFKYITSLRMEKAKELIRHEGLSISEASYAIGYKNPQHFTVAFKKFYGYLPSSLTHP